MKGHLMMAGLIPKFAALRSKAEEILPRKVFDYIDGGSNDEITLEQNRMAWRNVKLVPRVMRKIEKVDISCTLFGHLSLRMRS